MFTNSDCLLSTWFTHFICLPGYHLNMIAELLCVINFSCGLEESLILRVKDKQGWVEWSWASAASHGVFIPSQRQTGLAAQSFISCQDPKSGRKTLYLRDLKRAIVSLRVRARATTKWSRVFHNSNCSKRPVIDALSQINKNLYCMHKRTDKPLVTYSLISTIRGL